MARSLRALYVSAAAVAALVPSLLVAQVPSGQAARVARIESNLRPLPAVRGNNTTILARMQALHVPAVSVAVIDSGRIVWAKAYGLADVASARAATPATRFQAASMSKPVAAMGALRLVAEGKLSLDTDINATLRSWKLPANDLTARRAVTLRMLLTHTGGLTVHGFAGSPAGMPVPTVIQVLDGILPSLTPPVRVEVVPGTAYQYSGGGMTIAQLMMTDVTGEPFPSLVRRLVLTPAGMTSSGYEQPLPDSLVPVAASAYQPDGTLVPGNWHTYPQMMAAGLWTTASDLGRFIIEVQHANAGQSRILDQAMTRAMLTPGLGSWGLGIRVDGAGDSLRFSHGGANNGYRGQFVGYVAGGRGVVVLTNSDVGAGLADEIIGAVAREYDWPGLRAIKEHVPFAIDSLSLDRFVGKYQLAPGFVIAVSRAGAQLSVQATGQGAFPIFPEGPREFFASVSEIQVQFEVDAQGKTIAALVTQAGRTARAPRIE